MLHSILKTNSSKMSLFLRVVLGAYFMFDGINDFTLLVENPALTPVGEGSAAGAGSVLKIAGGLLLLAGLFTRIASTGLICFTLFVVFSDHYQLLADKGFKEFFVETRTYFSIIIGLGYLLLDGGGFWALDRKFEAAPVEPQTV